MLTRQRVAKKSLVEIEETLCMSREVKEEARVSQQGRTADANKWELVVFGSWGPSGNRSGGVLAECARPVLKLNLDYFGLNWCLRILYTTGEQVATGFSPQSRSPGGGLTATYRTPYEEPCAYEPSAAEGVFLNSIFSDGF